MSFMVGFAFGIACWLAIWQPVSRWVTSAPNWPEWWARLSVQVVWMAVFLEVVLSLHGAGWLLWQL